MKWFAIVLVLGSAVSAHGDGAPVRAPLPRPRILQTASGAVAQQPKAGSEAISLPAVEVTQSKLPTGPARARDPEPSRFSLFRGGPVLARDLGGTSVQIGMWAWRDIFEEDAKFRAPKVRVDFQLVRISR